MDKRSDDIRQDIESTRASIDEKIDMLENKASSTIDSVKQTFDVKRQVGDRPWVALGLAVAAGYVLGNLGNDDKPTYSSGSGSTSYSYDYNQHANTGPSTMDTLKAKSSDFLSQFDDEIDMLKVAAMTALAGFVRDAAREAVPALGPQIDRLLKERGLGAATTGSSSYSSSARSYSSTPSGSYGSDISTGDNGLSRSTAPNASMDYETNAGKVNNDAMPQMNRYGTPPPTPSRDDQEYYTTYQPGEDQRTVGGDDKY